MNTDVKVNSANSGAKHHREPLVHIIRRPGITAKRSILVRTVAVVAGFVACALVTTLLAKASPLDVVVAMFLGVFDSMDNFLDFLTNSAFLLLVSLAVTPAFKMRFWNCGAEGQVLIGGLACVACRMYFGTVLSLPLLIIVMVLASMLASIVWAVIPAIFKAFWNTNETLFTLMMNYVAMQLVSYCLKVWVPGGSGVISTKDEWSLPSILDSEYIYIIIIAAAITVAAYVYLKYSKHGYEISVVGESENTAKYVGINVKKVIVRTLVISGALCGIAGLLIVHNSSLTITRDIVDGRGFTAIMVSWLAKFDPLYMVLTTFLVVFLQKGAGEMESSFGVSPAVADVVTAIILLFIIGCEFFINYKVILRKKAKDDSVEEVKA